MSGGPEPRRVHVGRWSLRLDPDGSLRRIRLDGELILCAIAFVLRDQDWTTVPGETHLEVDQSTEGVSARVTSTYELVDGCVTLEGHVIVMDEGIVLSARCVSDGTVRVNRAGFVLLHPLSLAGRSVTIRHPDGSATATSFPVEVAPHQPFRDVSGLEHSTDVGATVHIDLDGEVFETEDQRNWSDASFKTYSRPLAMPFPFQLEAGTALEQRVAVHSPASTWSVSSAVLSEEPESRARPLLGVTLGPDDDPRLARMLGRELGLDYVRVDVVVDDGCARGLNRLVAVADVLPIELVVHVGHSPNKGLEELAGTLREFGTELSALVVFDMNSPATTHRAVDDVRGSLGDLLADVPLLVGSDDNFAELNRNRPDPAWGASAVTFGLTPQVHDESDEAVLSTVAALDAMVRTARTFAPAVAIGALSLRPRRNIYKARRIDRLARDSTSIDPRQHDEFAARWLTATLTTLTQAGVTRITALEFGGGRGLTDPRTGALAPVTHALKLLQGST